MINVLLTELAKVTQGEIFGEDVVVNQICTDSRSITANCAYLALVGDKFDGHTFCQQVVEKGVKILIVNQPQTNLAEHVSQLVVKDTLIALGQIAALNKQKANVKTVAITGSCGKTTVKEMLAAICRTAGKTLATKGNFNNHIGVPLTLLNLEESDEFAIIEMGASQAGDIAYTVNLATPDVAMVNNVAAAHLEGFGSLMGVALAKGEIYQGLSSSGIAVVNMDCDYVETWQQDLDNLKQIGFSSEPFADLYYSDLVLNQNLCPEFKWHYRGQSYSVTLNIAGEHNAQNALAAIACAIALGISAENINLGLSQAETAAGRVSIKKPNANLTVIDDSYNANLSSMKSAIELVSKAEGTRIFVMGDIGELGQESQAIHSEIGEFVAQNKIDKFYTKGQMSRFAQAKAENHFASFDALIEQILIDINTAVEADQNAKLTVLVKGSRSQKMENVVNALVQSNEEKV
ncbi:UDP-N-acetylmuramoyl-tripeptide--D-alanyl-D-alanine ligase [Catenovulum maritimum]|uniref:UDP-N-acetylmuramoyl-tripeptide--D-alanyl-D-alanine ligase n=1 Tax=Catenovulum maritimum TaxID=1513271 RepID=A0A0J8GY24_9ALTE|nr:UDP-N-acetylmuramoyl-tripeptide--D-alanyl-D-alanine ligase [Catenovulum maritimum]KMT65628.1 hypothetical protein XM47_07985 [Catenovulum maritimum]